MSNHEPSLEKSFCCIINRDSPSVAALIASHLYDAGKYLCIFEMMSVSIPNDDNPDDYKDEYFISRSRAREFSIHTHNSINRLKHNNSNFKYIILGDLSDDQKSYLNFLSDYNVIEINDKPDAELFLAHIGNKTGYINCVEDQLFELLPVAFKNNKALRISSDISDVENDKADHQAGVIVIENEKNTSTVIAMNYAVSIDARIILIELPSTEPEEINYLIEEWKNGSDQSFNDLSSKIFPFVEHINFKEYEFCTFFTRGYPYSLVLNNIIPFTYVNLKLSPDFFIFNNIFWLYNEASGSSIVFSPLEFGEDEETTFVIDRLKQIGYYVEELVGETASVYNLDMHVKLFPFELLHLCSHGGEVDGFLCKEEFIDRNGIRHLAEYEEVFSSAIEKGHDKIHVTTLRFWRKLDGMVWKSDDLKSKNYPNYVYSDMAYKTGKLFAKEKSKKAVITNSNGIKCVTFNYLAQFNSLAGQVNNPVIFNNTCWSWIGIADSFIGNGAQGYIGTLWNIDNDIAKRIAEKFYKLIPSATISKALFEASKISCNTKDENIYLFWGLHLTKINAVKKKKEYVRYRLIHEIFRSLVNWSKKLSKEEFKDNEQIQGYYRWLKKKLIHLKGHRL